METPTLETSATRPGGSLAAQHSRTARPEGTADSTRRQKAADMLAAQMSDEAGGYERLAGHLQASLETDLQRRRRAWTRHDNYA